ncbi:bifunctional glycosyltransferase/CDP-glycerol:glycerophosphate glycerophosphotransferase [Streptomyces ipomoeae]|uniref:bifunctional glycosyltransferase/CDP-glycerol:glycerophosphate glycerophosphotransferase n=1 Tax=Streptomyces ipomoeae TaxID=103232 RepID=UPI0029BC2A05|nr:bifunctional glycosyltransferase family 2 protein/CDP-glycerol:glycerophosphate glycerophosphotransferase [Streptomyces ipomoeae]MDX2700542.1 bifunctional glycosyltransferase family 2 protein/CDP-glycerol:glycerophosphate glycerophosphotransferase [Streptomyces ipomoeae]
MPRFSIIVPTHGVEGHLPHALNSILTQPFGDFELLPIHDTRHSLAETLPTTQDTRVTPIESPPTAGLSGARNTGLSAAHGTYVLFLDGDDTLTPPALQAIANSLTRAKDPDVLYFTHERTPWWEATPTAVHPAGAHTPAWSAAYRRDFLTEHHLTFPPGHFTDLAWGGLVALAAARTAELRDTPCVRHLLRRQGDRLNTPGDHHLDLLDQVELVLVRATAEQALSDTTFERLFAVVLRTAAHPTRVPTHHRRDFFHRATHLYRHYRPTGFRPPTGRRGIQYRLLATGSYAAFRALSTLNRTTAEALAALHAEARRLAPRIRSVFLVEPEAVADVPKDAEYAVIGSRRHWKALARAKYVIGAACIAGPADAVVKRRPGSVHLHTHPGTPLNTTGVDRAPYPVVAATVAGTPTGLLSGADRWDFSLSSNRHSTETWERAFPGSYEQLEYGSPRNDVHYRATATDVARARRELGIPDGRTALLYAPAHRDHITGFDAALGTGHDARLDLEAFCEAVGEEFVVLVRTSYGHGHRVHDDDTAAYRHGHGHGRMHRGEDGGGDGDGHSGRIILVPRHHSTEDVCLAADALITDYSSLMFDYAHLDRPIVVHAEDWEVHREIRGVCLDLPSVPPGHVARTERELAELFRDGSYTDAEAAALRAEFRERFCQFDDGRAAERVVRRVFLGEPPESLPPVVPLAERTPAPAPRPAATLVRS